MFFNSAFEQNNVYGSSPTSLSNTPFSKNTPLGRVTVHFGTTLSRSPSSPYKIPQLFTNPPSSLQGNNRVAKYASWVPRATSLAFLLFAEKKLGRKETPGLYIHSVDISAITPHSTYSIFSKNWGSSDNGGWLLPWLPSTSCVYFYWSHSVQFSHSVVSNSLRPHGLQHSRIPCPSPTPGAYSKWCYPTILPSVVPFSSCLQSFPVSGSFQMCQFFTSGGQSVRVSASASVLPMNIQDC